MDQSIIALIIIGLAIVSFALEKIPLGLTAVLASLAMGVFGITDYSKVYSDFGSLPCIMVVGMMIVSDACFENGVMIPISFFTSSPYSLTKIRTIS